MPVSFRRLPPALAVFFWAFVFMAGAAQAMPEAEMARAERLLAALEARGDFIFIRNGSEYGLKEAVGHLKAKLQYAADRLNTAEEFVEKAASGSSVSGRPYLYKEKPGDEPRPLKPYLYELLEK